MEKAKQEQIVELKAQVYDYIAESEKAQVFINKMKEAATKVNEQITALYKDIEAEPKSE